MDRSFHLSDQQIIAFVATRDPNRARKFYADQLGLRLVSEELPFALVFDAHGIMLRVTIVKEFLPAGYTVLGWSVPDVALAAKALEGKGVKFQRYPGMNQDDLGVWSAPGGARVAWFQDPDGNTFAIEADV